MGLLTWARSASSTTGKLAKVRGSSSTCLATRCSAGGRAGKMGDCGRSCGRGRAIVVVAWCGAPTNLCWTSPIGRLDQSNRGGLLVFFDQSNRIVQQDCPPIDRLRGHKVTRHVTNSSIRPTDVIIRPTDVVGVCWLLAVELTKSQP